MSRAPYQILNPLRGEELLALENDILKRGVMVPVEVDPKGNILDGHNRVQIAKKHGLDYETIIRRFTSEQEKREHVIMLNLARRQLEPHEWGAAFRLLLEETGVRRGRGGDRKSKATVAFDSIKEAAKKLGVPERTAKHRMKAADDYENLSAKEKEQVDNKEKTIPQIKKKKKRRESEQKKPTKPKRIKNPLGKEEPDPKEAIISKEFKSAWDVLFTELKNAKALKWKTTSKEAAIKHLNILVQVTTI